GQHERVPSSRGKSASVSDGARPSVQPHPISASSQACRSVWCGSGRRTSTHSRLVPQSPDPHLRRLSMSRDTSYHYTTWKVMSRNSDALKNFPFEIKGLRKWP